MADPVAKPEATNELPPSLAAAVTKTEAAPHPALSVLAKLEAKLASLEGLWATEVRALVSEVKAHL